MTAFLIILFCVAVNIPMGIWRPKQRKFSWQWLAAIHVPVPLIVLLRVASEISIAFIPMFVLASVLAQYIGPKLRFAYSN